MSDVAHLAGVHRVTASVVLNKAEARTRVSEATRQRILEAARQLGYQPNAMALALRRRRTDIIGFYCGYNANAHDLFTAEVINGLQKGCAAHHKDLLLYGDFEGRSADEIYAAVVNGKIDGLVMIPSPIKPVTDRLVDSHLPIVAIADSLPTIVSVVVDDAAGSRLLAEHLTGKGHRRIMYRKDLFSHTSAVRRLATFKEVATAHGAEVIESLPADPGYGLSAEEQAHLRAPAGVRPTAVVCWQDTNAFTLLDHCERLGLRVPHDVAVAGFDGILPRARLAYRLTTVRAPWEQVAQKAVEMLLALMGGEEDLPQETVFPVELVVGDTT
jgi:DNA-binding LacI/PurR family transcriptional regulator